ncbi:MAG TPA: hypothetical protein V6C58_28570 [Allocoleopsis sp.]
MQCIQWKQVARWRFQKNQPLLRNPPIILKKYVRKIVHLEDRFFDRMVEDIDIWLKEEEEKEEKVEDMVLEEKI